MEDRTPESVIRLDVMLKRRTCSKRKGVFLVFQHIVVEILDLCTANTNYILGFYLDLAEAFPSPRATKDPNIEEVFVLTLSDTYIPPSMRFK